MSKKDGVLSIGIDYKKTLNQMISDFEKEFDKLSSNDKISQSVKNQFGTVVTDMKDFRVEIDKELERLGTGKVSKTSFQSFKQTVSNNFETIKNSISTLESQIGELSSQLNLLSNGIDINKLSEQFSAWEEHVRSTNDAIENLVSTLSSQGISLFSFDKKNILDAKETIKLIEKELASLDIGEDTKFHLFDEEQAQNELNRLAVELRSTLKLVEATKEEMSKLDKSSIGFQQSQDHFNALELKAARLNETIDALFEISESKGFQIAMDDKSFDVYDKYTEDLTDRLDTIRLAAEETKKSLQHLLGVNNKATIKVSSETNPNLSEPIVNVNIDVTAQDLWKKLSPALNELQAILNTNPVVAPVKLIVAPNAVSNNISNSVNGISSRYSKKYSKILATTNQDSVIDLEGIYKKTYTSIMDAAVSYAKEAIKNIQEIFIKHPVEVKFAMNQEEFDSIQKFLLDEKSDASINLAGQITEAKENANELKQVVSEINNLLGEVRSNNNFKIEGFEQLSNVIADSVQHLNELQNLITIIKNIDINFAKATGLNSVDDIENQWKSFEQLITNSTKVDGSFKKKADIDKIAKEYNKYLEIGGTNSLFDIPALKKNADTIEIIISKTKELYNNINDTSISKIGSDIDNIILKFDELISTIKIATNSLYKLIRQSNITDVDKKWNEISNRFKEITNESGKINLTKQKEEISELISLYIQYQNIGGENPFSKLTSNKETINKLSKVYNKQVSLSSPSLDDEKKSFSEINDTVNKLTKAIGTTKVNAIEKEVISMEKASDKEVIAINKVIDAVQLLVGNIKDIPNIKVPKIKITKDESGIKTDNLDKEYSSSNKSDNNKDSFLKKNKNYFDYEIEKRKSQSKIFSNLLKAQMQEESDYIKKTSALREYLHKQEIKYSNEASKIIKFGTPDTEYTKAFSAYEQAYKKFHSSVNQFNNDTIINPSEIDKLKLLQDELDNTYRKLQQLDKGSSDLSRSKLADKISKYINANPLISKEYIDELKYILRQLQDESLSVDVSALDNQFLKLKYSIRDAKLEGKGLLDAIKDKAFYGLAAQLGTYFSFNDFVRYIENGINTVRNFDTALTEMRKVSDESVASLKEFQSASFDIVNTVGATALTLQNSTADWMRLGESIDEATNSAKVSNILLNVSEFNSIDEATESLVSMSQAYKELDKIEIVDVANELGNNFAISTDGIATALKESASALKTAHNDFYEAAALVTAANTVVQDPNKVGAGIRTISLRLTGTEAAKEELEELGEDTSDFSITTVSKLNDEIKALTKTQGKLGVSLLDINGNYRSTYEILLDISKVWEQIGQEDKANGTNRQNALLEKMAGKNRANILASILQSPDVLEDAYNSALNANGSSTKELNKFLDSIDGRLLSLQNNAQEFWVTFINSDTVKNGISLLSNLLEILNKLVGTIGSLGTISTIGGGILGANGLG